MLCWHSLVLHVGYISSFLPKLCFHFLSAYLPIPSCLPTYLFNYLRACLPAYLLTCQFTYYQPACRPVYLPNYLLIYLPVYVPTFLTPTYKTPRRNVSTNDVRTAVSWKTVADWLECSPFNADSTGSSHLPCDGNCRDLQQVLHPQRHRIMAINKCIIMIISKYVLKLATLIWLSVSPTGLIQNTGTDSQRSRPLAPSTLRSSSGSLSVS